MRSARAITQATPVQCDLDIRVGRSLQPGNAFGNETVAKHLPVSLERFVADTQG